MLALFLSTLGLAAPYPLWTPARHTLYSLVSIDRMTADGWSLAGSGTLVKSRLTDHRYEVVTATHVIEPIDVQSERMPIRVCGMPQGKVECVVVEPEAFSDLPIDDVTLLGIDTRVAKVSPLGTHMHVHDKVLVQGFPEGDAISVRGQVIGKDPEHVMVLAWCDYGSSGGGVFHHGRLVGIAVKVRLELIALPMHGICYVQPVNIQ